LDFECLEELFELFHVVDCPSNYGCLVALTN
jgi:hypothetical protein